MVDKRTFGKGLWLLKDDGKQFGKVTKSYNVGTRKPLTDHKTLITNLIPKTW